MEQCLLAIGNIDAIFSSMDILRHLNTLKMSEVSIKFQAKIVEDINKCEYGANTRNISCK